MNRNCKQCKSYDECLDDASYFCIAFDPVQSAKYCTEFKSMTNADRIRAMSDEELAEFLCGVYDDDNCGIYKDECDKFINGTIILDYDKYKIAEWLKQPAEVEHE